MNKVLTLKNLREDYDIRPTSTSVDFLDKETGKKLFEVDLFTLYGLNKEEQIIPSEAIKWNA